MLGFAFFIVMLSIVVLNIVVGVNMLDVFIIILSFVMLCDVFFSLH
jgi:hypothetical protein